MQRRIGILRASSRLVARGAYALALIAASFGWAPVALAKKTPNAVIEVTPAGGSTYGDKLTMYGIVSAPTAADPVPTGTIRFEVRDPDPPHYAQTVCSVTIDTDYPVQSCDPIPGLYIAAGTHRFILIYSGDNNYEGNPDYVGVGAGMLANEDNYVIDKQTPTISLVPPAPVFVGQYAALQLRLGNATNTDGQFGATIAGDNGDCSILYEGQICSAGKTRFAGTAIPVYAGFVGDNNHNAVPTTEVGQITILPAPTTLKIEPHPAITLGDTANIVLSVSTIIDPGATFLGDFTLSDGEVSCQFHIQNLITTSVECPLTPISAGTRQLTASYSGSSNATPSTATGTLEVVAAKVDGACGSDNGGVLAATPTNLCSAGTPGAVSGAGHPWSWTCAGISGGNAASCSATIRTWTVSAQASGSGGSITPPSQTIDNGNAATLAVSADAGYVIAGVTGCGGSLAGNTYTTAPVSADCTVTATFTKTATKPVPVLTWPAPASIAYGTALGAAQLNATASWNGNPVAGTFTYTPAAGTLLNVGANQVLSATFVPSDTASYATPGSPVTTTITVNAAPLTPVTMTLTAAPATITQGQSVLLTATVNGSAVNPTSVETIGRRMSSTPSALAAAIAPTGGVTFHDGGTVIGSVNLGGNGIAALSVSTFAAGTRHVIATYAGDATFAPATATATVVVTAAALQAPVAAPALDQAALWLLSLLFAGLGAALSRNKGRLRVR